MIHLTSFTIKNFPQQFKVIAATGPDSILKITNRGVARIPVNIYDAELCNNISPS